MKCISLTFSIFFISIILSSGHVLAGGAYPYQLPRQGLYWDADAKAIVGALRKHVVKDQETLLDVARQYNLGFNEVEDLYPQQDPWLPSKGMELIIPTQWILPDTRLEGIVINIPEMRLYYFMKKIRMVKTCPVGIGNKDWQTPLGIYQVTEKRIDPAWFIPRLLQEKYGFKIMAPGAENPLGEYWVRLGESEYGIHGTHIPWSVGRMVTHGCIRLYPEDMEQLFELIESGTPVEIIYEPIKTGVLSGSVFVEVHKDIYDKIEDFFLYGYHRLAERGVMEMVDLKKFHRALQDQTGHPVDITLYQH